jgi:hypothetical protein
MADDAVKFNRTPYKVSYRDLNGDLKTIRRVPPPKLHDALPTDVVKLTRKKNDDFQKGDEFEVVSISDRQPNVLQLQRSDGTRTFVDHYDIQLEKRVAFRDGVDPRDEPINNKYLLWP